MTKIELRKKLHAAGVNPHYYNIEGATILEGYCLTYQSGKWCVFYSERGLENNKICFDYEAEACEHLYKTILNDPLSRS